MKNSWLIGIITVLSLVLAYLSATLRFDTRPQSALPTRSPAAQAFKQFSDVTYEHGVLIVLVVGDKTIEREKIIAITLAAQKRLASLSHVRSVFGQKGTDDVKKLLASTLAIWPQSKENDLNTLFSDEFLIKRVDDLKQKASLLGGSAMLNIATLDPLGILEHFPKHFSPLANIDLASGLMLTDSPPLAVLFVQPDFVSSQGQLLNPFMQQVRHTLAQIGDREGIHFEFTGTYAYADEYQTRLRQGLLCSGIVSLALLLAACLILFRDVRAMLLVAASLFLASIWTLGFARLLVQPLHILAVSAASILPAIGIDAGVHFYERLLAETGSMVQRAWVAAKHVSRPLFISAAASVAGFASFCAADVPAFYQFGLLLALGVVCNLIATLIVLPVLFIFADHFSLYRLPAHEDTNVWQKWGTRWGRQPRWKYAAILFSLIFCLLLLFRPVRYAFGFSDLNDPSFAAAQAQKKFEQAFHLSSRYVSVLSEGNNEDEAVLRERRVLERLETSPMFRLLPVQEASRFWVTAQDRALLGERVGRLHPDAVAAQLRVQLEKAGFVSEKFTSGLSLIAQMGTPSVEAVPEFLRFAHETHVSRTRQGAISFMTVGIGENGDVSAIVDELRSLVADIPGVSFTGSTVFDGEMNRLLLRDLRLLTMLSIGLVVLTLILSRLDRRRLLLGILSLALIFTLLWLALGAFRIEINLVNLLVFPFVLGVGIDATVYLLVQEEVEGDRENCFCTKNHGDI